MDDYCTNPVVPVTLATSDTASETSRVVSATAYGGSQGAAPLPLPRKTKACAACRKQKIRCFMDSGPPCRRCAKKSLDCITRKNLPALIEEGAPFTNALLQDLEAVHANVQTLLRSANLPAIASLQISKFLTNVQSPSYAEQDHPGSSGSARGPSCDESPKLSPEEENDLPETPIRSIYHLTKLTALRSGVTSDDRSQVQSLGQNANARDDLISRGLISLDAAERLFKFYMERLDGYIYNVVGSRYRQLAAMRQKSPILTAAVMTVAAMHDAQSNNVYPVFNDEVRRLINALIFEQRIDRDHLRALCVTSYWLYDTSWVFSGLATRRAAEFDIGSHYDRLSKENSEDAADFVRVWYLIYICDQHLSTLYGRQCSSREDSAILGWESLINANTVTTADQRLVSQVSLLTTLHEIRELFRPGSNKVNTTVFLTQLKGFGHQLDRWVEHWSSTFPEQQKYLGAFPRKGAYFHYNFAKLYLYSHALRGLGNSPLPPQLTEAADCAVSAAVSILKMIISDNDVAAALVGLPCYVQSMIGFACMFLAKFCAIHGDILFKNDDVIALISQLKDIYSSTEVGQWHLVHLMPAGFDRVLAMLQQNSSHQFPSMGTNNGGPQDREHGTGLDDMPMSSFDPLFPMEMGAGPGTSQYIYFDDTNYGTVDPLQSFN